MVFDVLYIYKGFERLYLDLYSSLIWKINDYVINVMLFD